MNKTRQLRVRLITPTDAVILLFLIVVGLAAVPHLRNGDAPVVVIYRENEIIAKYPLNKNVKFPVRGYHGPMRIAIEDQSVRVLQSSCANKTCVHTGRITTPNRQIVCAPNHVLVQIETSDDSGEIDAFAR